MKNIKLLLIAMTLTLSACGGKGSSSEETTSSISSDSTSEVVSSSSKESSSSSSSYSSIKVVPEVVKNSPWGEEAAQACYDTLGTVVPFLAADAFEYELTKDDYGDPAIWFYLFYETSEIAEAKINEYAYAAYEQDQYLCKVAPQRFFDQATYSTWEQPVLYADKNLSDKKAVEIVGLESLRKHNDVNTPCLGLFCYNYIPNLDKTQFPFYPIETIIGKDNDVPDFGGDVEGLTYDFGFGLFDNDGGKFLGITVTSTISSFEIEEYYFYSLLQAGFVIYQFDELKDDFTDAEFKLGDEYPEFEDTMMYYAYPKKGQYCVSFQYDLYNQIFLIQVIPFEG